MAAGRPELQKWLRSLCASNILFWINLFVWAFDTRDGKSTTSPFITFDCQDEAVNAIVNAISPKPGQEQHDVMLLKSRDMGATWICSLVYLWFVLFHPDRLEFFCMSYKESLVDGGGKSIFGKLDYALEHMPSWLLPRLKRTELLLKNMETGSTIEGESTTARSGVGGRYRSMFLDEMQLIEDAESVYQKSANCSNARIFNGTPNGTHTQFYRISQMPDVKKVELHWTQHAMKAKGLPAIEGKWTVGRWRQEGKPTTPWYLAACKRLGNNKQAIAENLDIDFKSAGWQFFDAAEIARLITLYTRPPLKSGTVTGDTFVEHPNGHMRLWCFLRADGRPPKDRYGIGCDVATGVGGKMSTPSTISVVSLESGKKVAELADPFLRPDRFAMLVARIARWFWEALVIWENAGPTGAEFRRTLLEDAQYHKVYLRKKSERSLAPELTNEPGWSVTDESKGDLLAAYRAALSDGTFNNPSKPAMEETLHFVFDGRTVSHALQLVKDNPSGAKANHGDQVTADALANLLVREDGTVARTAKVKEAGEIEYMANPPVGSMAWRDMMEEREMALSNDGWGRD